MKIITKISWDCQRKDFDDLIEHLINVREILQSISPEENVEIYISEYQTASDSTTVVLNINAPIANDPTQATAYVSFWRGSGR
jgi:hypothetical protein